MSLLPSLIIAMWTTFVCQHRSLASEPMMVTLPFPSFPSPIFRLTFVVIKALVEFHEKIWNNPDAYNDVFSTRQVKRDGTLTDVDIPSQCCVMHPPFVYSSKYITGIFIRNEYVQAIKDIVAFWLGEKFAPNADNTEESNDEADMVMCSGDVGLYGDMAMETSVRGAAPSAPTPFPSAIDNPFLSTKFPPGPLRCGVIVTGSPGIGEYSTVVWVASGISHITFRQICAIGCHPTLA